jgi:hypothetical protein
MQQNATNKFSRHIIYIYKKINKRKLYAAYRNTETDITSEPSQVYLNNIKAVLKSWWKQKIIKVLFPVFMGINGTYGI